MPTRRSPAVARTVIGEVAALHDISSKGLRSWLVNHFVTDGGSRGIIHEGMATTADLPNAVPPQPARPASPDERER